MATLHYQAVGTTFRELVEARLIIEPLMAGLAAATRDRQLLDELRGVSERTREGLQDDFEYSSRRATSTVPWRVRRETGSSTSSASR